MPTDQFGFPTSETLPEEEEEIWRVLRLDPPDPLQYILDELQNRADVTTRTTITETTTEAVGRLFMLMGC